VTRGRARPTADGGAGPDGHATRYDGERRSRILIEGSTMAAPLAPTAPRPLGRADPAIPPVGGA
jgi:hypothetical protein